MQFLEQFKNHNSDYRVLGVRIPKVNINPNYAKKYNLDLSKDDDDILRQLCLNGYKTKGINKYPNKQKYINRIKFELDILKKLGFSRYILMVFDLIEWCDEQKIPRGWGRGSVAGSLIVYLLDLVALDPIKYGLLFERFINESRAKSQIINGEQFTEGSSLPDIDFDVCYLQRHRVIEYLEKKYTNRTAHISTLNTLSTKLVLKEVCKKLGNFSEEEAGRVSHLIDSDAGTLDNLEETLEKSDSFKKWKSKNEELYKVSSKLLGLPKNFGVHAAGIIVSYDEIIKSLPLEKRGESLVCAYTKDDVAECEIKLDALGLKNLTVLYTTAEEVGFNLKEFNVYDESIYEYLQNFEYTYGIFQLDGDTACRVTRKVKPKNLSDVSAISAIARPGALAFLDDFLQARETGNQNKIYEPIDEILKETAGVILYQEQTMRIAHEVYGFSLIEADILRKIIGKKKLEEVKEWEDKIKEAGKKKNIPEDATELFWQTVRASAKYQFNASHSYSYSYISVLCAYLKVNYPAAFFKNCLMLARTFQDSEARIQNICKELPHFGVKIKPPDLIKSEEDFTFEGDIIRYGIKSIKSISDKALEKLKSFNSGASNKFKLFESAKEAGINIGILSNLIKSGCLSSFDENRGLFMLEAKTWNLLSTAQKVKIFKFGEKYNYNILKILVDIRDGKLLYEGKEIIKTKENDQGKSPFKTLFEKYSKLKEEYSAYQKYRHFFNYLYEVDILGFAYSNKLYEVLKSSYNQIVHLGDAQSAPDNYKVVTAGIVTEASVGKTAKDMPKFTMKIVDEFGEIRVMTFNRTKYDRNTHERVPENNIDILKSKYGRLPEKNDICAVKGVVKDGSLIFAEEIRILNLEFIENA